MSEPSETSTAVQPAVPIFEVAFKKGMWWSIPAEMSQAIYEKYMNNEDAGYTWDWGNSRAGSYQPGGEETSINRYMIDFRTWEQRNLDNDRRRSVRLVWVAPERIDPTWTGEIPHHSAAQPVDSAGKPVDHHTTSGVEHHRQFWSSGAGKSA